MTNCIWCNQKKDNRTRNKYCSRKCYWESKKGMVGFWTGKKRPDISGENSSSWRGGPRKCECGNELKSRSRNATRCRKCYLEEIWRKIASCTHHVLG